MKEKTDLKKRFSEEQIIGVFKEAEAGMLVKELCRKHGVMVEQEQLFLPRAPNEVWSMDFVIDALSMGDA